MDIEELKIHLKMKASTYLKRLIRRLMKDQNLYVISIKKKKYSSYLGEISPAVPNLLN